MGRPRKIFRIEETAAMRREPQSEAGEAALRHAEVMHELAALRAALTAGAAAPAPRRGATARRPRPRPEAAQLTRIAEELAAVLKDSEQATAKILAAAEDIDQAANNLSAALRDESEQGLAQDIRDRVIQIFEACNFQDLASQRVGKVRTTLFGVEQEIARMLDDDLGPRDAPPAMHGPRLDGDRGHVSQGEIDAMFGGRRRSA